MRSIFLFRIFLCTALLAIMSALPIFSATDSLTVRIIGNIACNDGVDNDGDSRIDFPDDPGCETSTDTDEFNSGGSGGGGGGGGGGGSYTPPEVTEAIFRGKAYPGSDVTLLRDGKIVAKVPAGADANFQISISGLAGGAYTFGVFTEDARKIRSVTKTFTIYITPGVTTLISGIFLPPTIAVDKQEVRRGDPIAILGQSAPHAEISIVVNSEHEIIRTFSADHTGAWLYNFDSLLLEYGDHTTQARAKKENEFSTFSNLLTFKVGTKNVPVETVRKWLVGDLNDDGRVNLIDFSILAYWYKRDNPPAAMDLSGDSKADIVDFSIMAFHWTG